MVFYDIKKRKPHAVETGNWDGKRCRNLLVKDIHGNYHVVDMYEGFLDGCNFCDFYDKYDIEIKNVVAWCEIN